MISCPVIGQRAGSLPPIGRGDALLHGEIWKFLEPLEASIPVKAYTRRTVVDISSAEMTCKRPWPEDTGTFPISPLDPLLTALAKQTARHFLARARENKLKTKQKIQDGAFLQSNVDPGRRAGDPKICVE